MEEGNGEKAIGSRLLTMAGFFDIWSPSQTDVGASECPFVDTPLPPSFHPPFLPTSHLQEPPLFTYTVITVAANNQFSCIHDRMPVREGKRGGEGRGGWESR